MIESVAHRVKRRTRSRHLGYHFPSKEAPMARIEPLPMREIVDEEIRHACEDAERQTGISTSPRTYAKNPAAFKALGAFRAALAKESTLDPVLRELVRLKIAGLNRCRY
jgi:DNA gyrase/topoisomerase IV subunit B